MAPKGQSCSVELHFHACWQDKPQTPYYGKLSYALEDSHENIWNLKKENTASLRKLPGLPNDHFPCWGANQRLCLPHDRRPTTLLKPVLRSEARTDLRDEVGSTGEFRPHGVREEIGCGGRERKLQKRLAFGGRRRRLLGV